MFSSIKEELLVYFKRRVFFAKIVLFAIAFFLFARLFYLQVINYDNYARLSDSNRMRILNVSAERGFILDRNHYILVKNAPTYQLRIIKEDTKDINAVLKSINAVVPFDITKAKANIKKSYYYQPTVILRGLNAEQVAYFSEHSSDFEGIDISLQSVRDYPDGTSMSHILGYMGEVTEDDVSVSDDYRPGSYIGKSGVEKYYEMYLKGENGAEQVEVNTFGKVLNVLNEKSSKSGKNVVLTIDYMLQKYIADTLKDRRVAVTVLDINDNSILAMYSSPAYDLNMFSPFITENDWNSLLKNPMKPLLNRNIEGMYPPGSVFKTLMALAGLREGVITSDTTFKCTGSYKLNANFSYNCWKRHGHGDMNVEKGLAESCDVFFYNLGRLLEIDTIQEYANFFSLGKLTGIDLPNEKTAFFPSREWKSKMRNEVWFPGETVITSIGQGYMTTTPLQIAVMMSGIFNGGKIYKPHIVASIEDTSTNTVKKIEAEVLRSMDISESIKGKLLVGLYNSVYKEGGTSRRSAVAGVSIGGKTGTAQVVSLKRTEDLKKNDIPEHWRDHSWFTAVFPTEEPKYVIVVMVEHGGGGGASAAPVGGSVIKKMLELGYVSKN